MENRIESESESESSRPFNPYCGLIKCGNFETKKMDALDALKIITVYI